MLNYDFVDAINSRVKLTPQCLCTMAKCSLHESSASLPRLGILSRAEQRERCKKVALCATRYNLRGCVNWVTL